MPLRKPIEPDSPEIKNVVNATEFQKTPGLYQEMTNEGPLAITKYDRTYYVLLSYKDYQKMTGKTKRALHPSQLSSEDLSAISKAEVPREFAHLEELLKDD